MLEMSAEELAAFLDEHFPQIQHLDIDILRSDLQGIRVRLPFHNMHLRPGGTISGPTLMALSDTVMYLMVLARIGPKALAVTTSLNINFLRPAAQADVLAEGRLLKLGRRLAVGEVLLYSENVADPVAQATLTYAIPPEEPSEEAA